MKESARQFLNLAFPKILRTILLHTYILYQELGVLNIWESQLIWTLRTNLMIPDRGFGAASNTCTTTRVLTIYRIRQHLFQWQDRAVQCTNSDLSFRVRQSALIYNSGVWCTQMVSIRTSLFLHLRLLICSTHWVASEHEKATCLNI